MSQGGRYAQALDFRRRRNAARRRLAGLSEAAPRSFLAAALPHTRLPPTPRSLRLSVRRMARRSAAFRGWGSSGSSARLLVGRSPGGSGGSLTASPSENPPLARHSRLNSLWVAIRSPAQRQKASRHPLASPLRWTECDTGLLPLPVCAGKLALSLARLNGRASPSPLPTCFSIDKKHTCGFDRRKQINIIAAISIQTI